MGWLFYCFSRDYYQVFFLHQSVLPPLTLMTSFLQPPCHHLILVLLLLCPSLLLLLLNRLPLSGDSAETKCFLVSLCRWDCNKACQQEAWVALSHALCLPSLTPSSISFHPLTSHHHSPPGLYTFNFYFFISLSFPLNFVLLLFNTALLDLCLMLL